MSLLNFQRTAHIALAGATLALLGGVFGAGCGGGIDTTVEAGFCQQMAVADCQPSIVSACYGSNDATLETDTNSCILARSQLAKCNPSELPYHAEFADACLAAHGQVYASDAIQADGFQMIKDACLPVFNKGGRVGSQCTVDTDCDAGNGLRCIVRVGGKGTCQIPNVVQPGSSCAAANAQCPDGFFCETTLNCVQQPTAGGICGDGQPCGTGFRCNDTTHSCETQLQNGSTCKYDSDCVGGFCIGADQTGLKSGKCAAQYTFAFGSVTCSVFESGL
jgi:hypothetical protein